MVVHNFHVQRIFALPAETNAPLIVHTDAMLPVAVAFQGFQTVAVRRAQVIQSSRLMQQQQFAPRHALNLLRQPPGRLIVEQPLGLLASKTAYH